MKSLTNYQLERFTTVEFLPFGLDWTCVAEIQFSENKDLPNDNDPPRRQKVRNSTVEQEDKRRRHLDEYFIQLRGIIEHDKANGLFCFKGCCCYGINIACISWAIDTKVFFSQGVG